jgi:predicted MPP superfamily phosphohydrolase
VVLLGDLNASHRFMTERVPPWRSAAILARLRPPLGVHSVLGNHDWWDDPIASRPGRRQRPETERALLAAGIPVLENRAVRLRHEGRNFWLAGLGSMSAFSGMLGRWRGIDDLPATLTALKDDAPAILLAHEPDIFPRVPARIALTLSGHTHGGQVRLPGLPLRVPSNFGDRYAYGHIVEGGRHLIVSAGLGTSAYPVRFGAPPEIVLVELGQAAAAG